VNLLRCLPQCTQLRNTRKSAFHVVMCVLSNLSNWEFTRSHPIVATLYSKSAFHVVILAMARIEYRVATISKLLKIIGLFCKRALYKRQYSAKEKYDFKEPTNRSRPIVSQDYVVICRRSPTDIPLWLTPSVHSEQSYTYDHICIESTVTYSRPIVSQDYVVLYRRI